MFGGNFNGTGVTVYDPATYNPATGLRQAFAGNRNPTARISNTIKTLLRYYTPGATLTTNNIVGTPRATYKSDQFMGKIDYNIDARNQVFAQGNWLNSPVTNSGLFPGQGTSYPLDTELVNLGWNHTVSSTKVNTLRVARFNRVSTPTHVACSALTETLQPNLVLAGSLLWRERAVPSQTFCWEI